MVSFVLNANARVEKEEAGEVIHWVHEVDSEIVVTVRKCWWQSG